MLQRLESWHGDMDVPDDGELDEAKSKANDADGPTGDRTPAGVNAMNVENDEQLEWRDTYFILFQQADRPTLTQVEAAITESSKRLKLENLEADEDGMFESVLVQAPQDNAALEISYERGEAVIEQSVDLAKQLKDELIAKAAAADAEGRRPAGRHALRARPRRRF